MRSILLLTATLLLALAGAAAADEHEGEGDGHRKEPMAMSMPAGHPVELPEGLIVELKEVAPLATAYLPGTILGDMDELFGELFELATEQGLLSDETLWGNAYPDDLSQGIDETTRVLAGITIDPEAEVAEPLKRGTIPAGTYVMVEHRGAYEELAGTYTAIYSWAAENGVVFGLPTFEHYVTDPGVTPVEEWLTEIYLPFDHEAMKATYMADDDDDHDNDDEDDHDHGHSH